MKQILAVIGVMIASAANADTMPSLDELLEKSGLSDMRPALDAGEIVWDGRPSQEADDSALAGAMLVRLSAPMEEVLKFMKTDPTTKPPNMVAIDTSSEATIEESFSEVGFSSDESEDVGYLLAPEPTSDFNYSQAEIDKLAQFSRTRDRSQSDAVAAADAMRALLLGRFQDYRAHGISGIDPYQHGRSERVNPAVELERAFSKNILLKAYAPDFYAAIANYPKEFVSDYEHEHSWSRDVEGGRPMFSLKHSVANVQPDFTLIVERQYYMSQALDMLQVIIAAFPDGEGTVLVMLIQTSTGMVTGFKRPIAAPIGRRQMKKNIRPIFEALRVHFNTGA